MTFPEGFDEAEDRLLALEKKIAADAIAPVKAVFKRLMSKLINIWPGDDAAEDEKLVAVNRLFLAELMLPLSSVEQTIIEGAMKALIHGVNTAFDQLGVDTIQVEGTFKPTLPEDMAAQVGTLRAIGQAKLSSGVAMLHSSTTLDEAMASLTVASPIPNVERMARTITNKASNLGIKAVAETQKDHVLVWRAERDGCVDCLAYQGEERKTSGYPAGLTFGKEPQINKVVDSPPLHPNCRCTQWILHKDVAGSVKTALKREAQRSILRGWSVPTESQSVRVDAARRLLAKNPTMPRSVQKVARKAIAQGHFSRRDFPGTR